MKRISTFIYGLLSLIMVGGAVIASPVAASTAPAAGIWKSSMLVPGVSSLNTHHNAAVGALSCTAPGDCSAGGWYTGSAGTQPFVVDQKNGAWGTAKEVLGAPSLNGGQDAVIDTLSCASPGNCGAGGSYKDGSGQTQAFVVGETNGTWGAVLLEVPGAANLNTEGAAQVSSISCPSPGNCAAGGYYSIQLSGITQKAAFVADEKDGIWGTAQEVPGAAALTGEGSSEVTSVSCSAAGDCAAGGSAALSAYVVDETGGTWGTAQTVSGLGALPGSAGQVNSVSCNSPGNCSAVGQTGGFLGEGFGVTETNGTWGTAAGLPVPATAPPGDSSAELPQSVSCASPGNCAAGGFYSITDPSTFASLESGGFLVNETNGVWGAPEQVPGLGTLSGTVNSVSCPVAGYCTAVGTLGNQNGTESAVMTETNGTWGDPQAALGSGPANVVAAVDGLSCAAVGSCSMGGGFSVDNGQTFQAAVQDETSVVATSGVVQVKNRATGKCLNENQANGLLSTYTCLPATYVSLRWQVVSYSDGSKDLVSVQTGQAVRDNGLNKQLSLTTAGLSPMRFQNGGIFRFPDNLVIGVNNQGNFVPVIGSPSTSSLDNVRWDFGAVPA